MATPSYSETRSSGRDMLDSTPPVGRQRSAPDRPAKSRSKSKLASLALDTPEGEIPEDELSDEGTGSELDSHPVVQTFEHYAQARGHLQIVGTLMPAVLATVTDLLTLLDQLIPQQAAAMLSGAPVAGGMGQLGAGTSQPGMSQGPPAAGLGALAGVGGVGAPAGPPAMAMATPGAPMGAGAPMM